MNLSRKDEPWDPCWSLYKRETLFLRNALDFKTTMASMYICISHHNSARILSSGPPSIQGNVTVQEAVR